VGGAWVVTATLQAESTEGSIPCGAGDSEHLHPGLRPEHPLLV
jgi:hypothetical protein